MKNLTLSYSNIYLTQYVIAKQEKEPVIAAEAIIKLMELSKN